MYEVMIRCTLTNILAVLRVQLWFAGPAHTSVVLLVTLWQIGHRSSTRHKGGYGSTSMQNSRSFYAAAFREAWQSEFETAEKLPLSPEAMAKLKAHAVRDVNDTIDALMAETGAIKADGRPRTWADDEPVWRAWAGWYRTWTREEAARVIPEIVANCALDREARERDRLRDTMAARRRVDAAERVVDILGAKARGLTEPELLATMYPPKAGKARQACRRVVAMLDGLGVIGRAKCRDGATRLQLWRSLWPEDLDSLAAG